MNLGDWLWQVVAVMARTVRDYATSRSRGRHPSTSYVATDMAEEIVVHHITRYAVLKAMREGFSPIYAGLYAYDEVAHAFGPADAATQRMLKHVDHTIEKLASGRDAAGGRYELLILSDHGHIETAPFKSSYGRSFGAVLAELLPGFHVDEVEDKPHGPPPDEAKGRVTITKSGGAAHVYFTDRGGRMPCSELNANHPELARKIALLPQVSFVVMREGNEDVFLHGDGEARGEDVKALLGPYDDPDILFEQLSRLNSFQHAGDMIVFGAFIDGKQVNFEDQAGGHGSIGGEQLHPFVLAKPEWGLDISRVNSSQELHPVLSRLRDRLAG
jgi:hypothetical protein